MTFDDIDWSSPTQASLGADELETKKLCLPFQSDLSYIALQIQQRLDAQSKGVPGSLQSEPAFPRPVEAWRSESRDSTTNKDTQLQDRLSSNRHSVGAVAGPRSNSAPHRPTPSAERQPKNETQHKPNKSKQPGATPTGFDAEAEFRRQERSFSVDKCFVEFSKFCEQIPSGTRNQIKPQLRRLTWILPLVEMIYEKRWLVEKRHFVADTTASTFSMPNFAFSTLAEDVGLKHMIHQTCWDLLYSVMFYRDQNEELETFSNFLSEVYNTDDLMMYLHARSLVQKHLGINLRSKHKLQDPGVSKLFLPSSIIPVTQSHPDLREGTKRIYLTRQSCLELTEKILQTEELANFFVRRDVDRFMQRRVDSADPAGQGSVKTIEVSKFLEAVLLEFRSTPEAMVEFLKYGDVARNIDILNKLQQSSQKEDLLLLAKQTLLECTTQLKAAKANLAKVHANPPRKAAEQAAHKVQLRIASNKVERERRKARAARQAVKEAEQQTSGVWKTVFKDSDAAAQSATLDLKYQGVSAPVTAAIVRMVKHVSFRCFFARSLSKHLKSKARNHN